MGNAVDKVRQTIRTQTRPIRRARLQRRAPRRYRLLSLSLAGKRVVSKTLFFEDRPANAKLRCGSTS